MALTVISGLRFHSSSKRCEERLCPQWNSRKQGAERYASRPASLKYGWNAHNYLGFADAWELRCDESDEQLLNYFEAPQPVRTDAQARTLWLEFVRANRGAPVPDCVKPTITAQPSLGAALTIAATGALPLSYAWFAGESGDTRVPVENANESVFRPATAGRYWVRVANRCGVALSDAKTSDSSAARDGANCPLS